MGVKGLLPCLQSITRSVSLERYRGLTAAVDAMSWLHKGVFACDVKALAKSQRGHGSVKPTSTELKCINYTINKAESLRDNFGIEVILVIDGDSLPSKKEENAQRREERDKAFEKAVAAEKARDSRAARRFYAQSCSVTHKIRYELIKACKQLGIAFIVAPYEADAQMARLAHTGMVDLVITEDSDILVYGCPRALFKVDFETSRGQEIQLMKDLGENDALSFRNWTHDMFVFMCIISGCDYCKGVPGIGIKLAHKLVRVHRTPSKIFSALRGAGRMPPDFEEKFWIAFRTFRHQRVFCPSKQQIETLWPIAGSNHEVWPFLGDSIDPRIACKIADGTLHPSKKIAWDEALKSDPSGGRVRDDHRKSAANAELRTRRDATTGNVWHALVYGSNANDVPTKSGGKENEHSRSTHNDSSSRGMFSFFPKGNTRQKEDKERSSDRPSSDGNGARPPLQEIYVEADTNAQPKPTYAPPPAHHKDVPIHFHEYASRLVGKAFKPISRKRKKQDNAGTKSSKYVQKIWERCAEVKRPAKEDRVNDEDEENGEEKGVSRFKQDRSKMNASAGCDYGPEEGTNHFHIADAYGGSARQMQDDQSIFDGHQFMHGYGNERLRSHQTFDDGSVRHGPAITGRHEWHPEDFSSSATTCEESSMAGADIHAHLSSNSQFSHQHVFLPESSADSTLDERHLFAELQSIPDPSAVCDRNPNLYDCPITYDDNGAEEELRAFQQLQTTKKARSNNSARSDYADSVEPASGYADEADSYYYQADNAINSVHVGPAIGYTGEFNNCHENDTDVSVYQQLRTTIKAKPDSTARRPDYMDHSDHHVDHIGPLTGSAGYSFNQNGFYGGSASVAPMFEDGLLDTFEATQQLKDFIRS